jgi:hypothetical protein
MIIDRATFNNIAPGGKLLNDLFAIHAFTTVMTFDNLGKVSRGVVRIFSN